MARYRVEMTAKAIVTAHVYLEAIDATEARSKAMNVAFEGEALWKYDGVDDESIQIESADPC